MKEEEEKEGKRGERKIKEARKRKGGESWKVNIKCKMK